MERYLSLFSLEIDLASIRYLWKKWMPKYRKVFENEPADNHCLYNPYTSHQNAINFCCCSPYQKQTPSHVSMQESPTLVAATSAHLVPSQPSSQLVSFPQDCSHTRESPIKHASLSWALCKVFCSTQIKAEIQRHATLGGLAVVCLHGVKWWLFSYF